MAEGIAATFEVGDEVTVLRKEDRNGGGHAVIRKVTGTGRTRATQYSTQADTKVQSRSQFQGISYSHARF